MIQLCGLSLHGNFIIPSVQMIKISSHFNNGDFSSTQIDRLEKSS